MKTKYEIKSAITNYINGIVTEPSFLSTRPLRELFSEAEKAIMKAYQDAEDGCEERDTDAIIAEYIPRIEREYNSVMGDIKDILMQLGCWNNEAEFIAEDILNAIGAR